MPPAASGLGASATFAVCLSGSGERRVRHVRRRSRRIRRVSAPYDDDPVYLTELPDDLRARRAEAARRRRWRRRLVALAVLAVLGGVAAVAIVSLAGGDGGGTKAAGTQLSQGGGGEGTAPTTTSYPADWKPYTGPVPILGYHAIQPPVSGSAYPELFVPQADFVEQMKWLDEHGYEAVTLDQVEDAWSKGGELPPKPVVLTFEDGYLSQYVAAFPTLQHFHWPGVLNLVAEGADLPDADVRKMLEADPAWELASHTTTHADLTTLDGSRLRDEVDGSRRILQKRFGVTVNNFCYPAGRYDDVVVKAVADAGYRGATTEVPGLATSADPYVLNRIEIHLSDGLDGLVSKLRSAESDTASTG
jgi:peptidoglycan/xylan/chitin deacetylase (PgdA/CDA1 family)